MRFIIFVSAQELQEAHDCKDSFENKVTKLQSLFVFVLFGSLMFVVQFWQFQNQFSEDLSNTNGTNNAEGKEEDEKEKEEESIESIQDFYKWFGEMEKDHFDENEQYTYFSFCFLF